MDGLVRSHRAARLRHLSGHEPVPAKLDRQPQLGSNLDRLTGILGVDVIDELGAVPRSLLHADALRTTYGGALCHGLDPTQCTRPPETWGRVAVKILCGDFYQLPPAPASASHAGALVAKPNSPVRFA